MVHFGEYWLGLVKTGTLICLLIRVGVMLVDKTVTTVHGAALTRVYHVHFITAVRVGHTVRHVGAAAQSLVTLFPAKPPPSSGLHQGKGEQSQSKRGQQGDRRSSRRVIEDARRHVCVCDRLVPWLRSGGLGAQTYKKKKNQVSQLKCIFKHIWNTLGHKRINASIQCLEKLTAIQFYIIIRWLSRHSTNQACLTKAHVHIQRHIYYSVEREHGLWQVLYTAPERLSQMQQSVWFPPTWQQRAQRLSTAWRPKSWWQVRQWSDLGPLQCLHELSHGSQVACRGSR